MKRLGQSAITTGAGTTIYTVPTGYAAQVKDMTIANTTSGALTALIHFVASGGSASAANTIFPTITIPAYTMVHWTGQQTIASGGFIQGIGSGAGITVTISGDEERA